MMMKYKLRRREELCFLFMGVILLRINVSLAEIGIAVDMHKES